MPLSVVPTGSVAVNVDLRFAMLSSSRNSGLISRDACDGIRK
jgi:hypothetical protein